ncbi:MAG: STM2901 family protein [Mixta sp.]
MDTTEQLNGTYFYGGLHNLSARELLIWVMIDEISDHFGAKDILGAAMILVGDNSIAVSGKFKGATSGTSYASRAARRITLRNRLRLPFGLPTIVGYPPNVRLILTRKLGTFIGRTVPVVGWVILASDISTIAFKTVTHYNFIVKPEDRIML